MAIQEIIKNKKYKIDVPIGYNGTKRIRHIETFYGGKKEAILRENEIKISKKNNTYINKTKLTFKDLIEKWLENQKNIWSPRTYRTNIGLSKTVIERIGHIHIQNINTEILEDFYNTLRKETKKDKYNNSVIKYSENTIQHFYTFINSVLNKAVIWNYILTNPNKKIEKPKFIKKDIACYSPEEVEMLVSVLNNEPLKYQAIIMLALDSGARRGEITGLTWEDINLEEKTIFINKTTQYIKEIGIFEKTPKTQTSIRKIYISDFTIEILKKYKKEQLLKKMKIGTQWGNSKRVFTTEFGNDMHPDTPTKILEKVINKYNLKKISFHGLRHTCISLQINSGIQVQIISKRAGHSNITVTHNTYSHFFENEFKEVANVMNNILTVKAN